jgi:hypothetical protein
MSGLLTANYQFITSKGNCTLVARKGSGIEIFVIGQAAGTIAEERVAAAMRANDGLDELASEIQEIAGQEYGSAGLHTFLDHWRVHHFPRDLS